MIWRKDPQRYERGRKFRRNTGQQGYLLQNTIAAQDNPIGFSLSDFCRNTLPKAADVDGDARFQLGAKESALQAQWLLPGSAAFVVESLAFECHVAAHLDYVQKRDHEFVVVGQTIDHGKDFGRIAWAINEKQESQSVHIATVPELTAACQLRSMAKPLRTC